MDIADVAKTAAIADPEAVAVELTMPDEDISDLAELSGKFLEFLAREGVMAAAIDPESLDAFVSDRDEHRLKMTVVVESFNTHRVVRAVKAADSSHKAVVL